jgi:hypothetical protein
MKMQHLLVNRKYKELWGKTYMKVDALLKASPESAKAPTLSFSSDTRTSQTTPYAMSRTQKSARIIAQRRRTLTAH